MACTSGQNSRAQLLFERNLAVGAVRAAIYAVCENGSQIKEENVERIAALVDYALVRLAAVGIDQEFMVEISNKIGYGEPITPKLIVTALGVIFEIEAETSPDDAAAVFHSMFAATVHRKGTEYKWK